MKRHWRYLVARYGAYPVVWCLAGEASMAWYRSEQRDADGALQKRGWTDIARYLHEIDPCGHPITIHPTDSARNTVEDPAVLDFDMLQTGTLTGAASRSRSSVCRWLTRKSQRSP